MLYVTGDVLPIIQNIDRLIKKAISADIVTMTIAPETANCYGRYLLITIKELPELQDSPKIPPGEKTGSNSGIITRSIADDIGDW